MLQLIAPKLFNQGGLEIGPIPAGTPVDLLANFDPLPQSTNFRERLAHDKAVVKAVVQLARAPETVGSQPTTAARRAGAAITFFTNCSAAPRSASRCATATTPKTAR